MVRMLAGMVVRAALLWGAVALVAFLVLRLEPVQRAVGEQLLAALDREIQGSVEVDEILDVSPGQLHVRGFRVYDSDPERTLVLSIDDARVTPDLSALLDGTIGFSTGSARGARVLLEEGDEGLRLEHAFDGPGPDTGGGGGARIDLRAIFARDVDLVLAIEGAPRTRCRIDTGRVAISTLSGDAIVRFRTGEAECEIAEPSMSVGLAAARGDFDGDARERLTLRADARVDGAPLPFELRLLQVSEDGFETHLRLDTSDANFVGHLAAIGLTALQLASPGLHVHAPTELDPPEPAK